MTSDESMPPSGAGGGPKARRGGGPRREVSDPVWLVNPDRQVEGWALNESRGGLRAILSDDVAVGDAFEVRLGEPDEQRVHSGRIVWVRSEKDGAIVGIAYTDVDGSIPPPPQ